MRGNDRIPVGGISCMQAGCAKPVANLSVGGFFVITDDPPARGEPLDVELLMPWGRALPVSGRVAWVNEPQAPATSTLPPGFGVRLERVTLHVRVEMFKALRETGLPRTPELAGANRG